MRLRVLVVPDKFKGTLTARAAAERMAAGWRQTRPGDALELLPMSDGGDGFGEVLAELLHLDPIGCTTIDAAHRPRVATWWWNEKESTGVVESAQIIGLALMPPKQFHPFELDTFGLGAVFQALHERGARLCIMGIGGSATNDAGFGMARALGWSFLDKNGHPLTRWLDLAKLERIVPPRAPVRFEGVQVAVDVQNPLLGPSGASRIYGPQKGLKPEDFDRAESSLGRLAGIVHRDLGLDLAECPGTGAAGGLGYGLASFMGAKLESGFELFARHANLEERIQSSDLVITGEGAIDRSSLMGKGVGEVARLCRKHRVPCVGLAGKVGVNPGEAGAFALLRGMAPELAPAEETQRHPEVWLSRLASMAAAESGLQGMNQDALH